MFVAAPAETRRPRKGGPWLVLLTWVALVAFSAGLFLAFRHFDLPGFFILGAVPAGIFWRLWPELTGNRVSISARLLWPLVELARELLPLLLLGFAFLFFAAGGFPPLAQVGCGFLFVAYLALLIASEGENFNAALAALGPLRTSRRVRLETAAAALALALPFVAALLLQFASSFVHRFEQVGGWATLFAFAALVLWFVSALLRLFASAQLRMLAALPLAIVALRFAVEFGLVPGYGLLKRIDPLGNTGWLVVLLCTVVGFPFLQELLPRHRHRRLPADAQPHLSRLGLAGALVASAVFGVAVLFGLAGPTSATPRNRDAYGPLRAGLPVTPPSSMSPQELATTFAPFLKFDREELWRPMNVRGYLRDARLVPIGDNDEPAREEVTFETLPKTCPPGARSPCWQLTCRGGDGSCAKGRHHSDGRFDEGTVYARVVRRDPVTPQPLFQEPSPFYRDLTQIVQYWIFYRYDLWRAITIGGIVRQHHEGDWEFVTIGLSDTKPLFVAYSAHCGGRWFRWSSQKIEAQAATRATDGWADRTSASVPALHPVVAVATGSHANYVHSWDGRAPAWGSCGANVSAETTNALSYVWNVRDRTGDDWEVRPRYVVLVDEKTPPMSFRGRWGASDRIALHNFRDRPIGQPGPGPSSPPLQDTWRHPLRTIFCGRHWRPKGGCRLPPKVLGAPGSAAG